MIYSLVYRDPQIAQMNNLIEVNQEMSMINCASLMARGSLHADNHFVSFNGLYFREVEVEVQGGKTTALQCCGYMVH